MAVPGTELDAWGVTPSIPPIGSPPTAASGATDPATKTAYADYEGAERQLEDFQGKPPQFKFDESAPQNQQAGVMQRAPLLLALTAIGGKAFKLHGKAMLGATNGMVKGLIQGSQQAYQDAEKQYEDHYKQALQKYQTELQLYNHGLEMYKGRVDQKLRALEFARQVNKDNQQVTWDDFNKWIMTGKYMDELERTKIMRDKADQGGGQGKAPPGFMWDPENPGSLKPIPGGPKDPNAPTSQGSREAVFTGRMITSANQAMKAVNNLMKLPISADRGIFGSVEPGHSIFTAPLSSLSNEVTKEESQLYQVMSAGVTRALSSIEAVGLMPSGQLTNQMEAVNLKPGDTYLTKLSRMAEIRQIVEGGMEPILSNPRVPEQQKKFVADIVNKIKEVVPFTQEDVIDLSMSKNPQVTIEDVMKSKGLGKKPPSSPDIDALLKKYPGNG